MRHLADAAAVGAEPAQKHLSHTRALLGVTAEMENSVLVNRAHIRLCHIVQQHCQTQIPSVRAGCHRSRDVLVYSVYVVRVVLLKAYRSAKLRYDGAYNVAVFHKDAENVVA